MLLRVKSIFNILVFILSTATLILIVNYVRDLNNLQVTSSPKAMTTL